jgi:hypothetical protein
MDTPPVVENLWRLIAKHSVVQIDPVLEGDGVMLHIYLADENVIMTFLHLPEQCRTERGARTVAAWVYRGLILDEDEEDSGGASH